VDHTAPVAPLRFDARRGVQGSAVRSLGNGAARVTWPCARVMFGLQADRSVPRMDAMRGLYRL
jgi:hypothetical protein